MQGTSSSRASARDRATRSRVATLAVGSPALAPGRVAGDDEGALLRAKKSFQRLYGRGISALFRGLEGLPLLKGQRRRLFESIEFTSTDVRVPGAGAGLDGLRIAWVSDLHAGFYLEGRELARLGERIAELEPDVLCLGGDLVANHFHELDHLEGLLEVDPPLGTYAVPGNHEHFYFERPGSGMAEYADFLERRGARVLTNRGVRLERDGATIWLCGVDDLDDGRPDFERALAGRRTGEPAVLLSHHPDTFPESVARDVDLQLSGHTHGGQVRLFGWAPITHSRHGFCDGLFRRERSHLYVGRGVGCSFLPVRVGARPEVPVLRVVA